MSVTATKVLTDRINRIEVSATMAITAEALKMEAAGINLANFGAGEPHFATPRHIKDAAIKAIENNFSKYTAVAGVPAIRKAVVERHAADFGSNYSVEECVFTTGGKLALFNAIQVLVDHGDEVILPVPYWVSFKDIIQYAGGKVVLVESDEREDFRITAKMIEAAITPKTKAIILNTPSNPSGAVVSPADLEAIVRLAHARGIYVLLDECYVYLSYTGAAVSGGSFTDCKEHVVILGSLSKTYAMTGWRAGFALGTEADHRSHEQVAVAEYLEHRQHGPAGFHRRAHRLAGLRGGDARRLPQAARSDSRRVQDHPRPHLHRAAGSLLCLSERQRIHRQGRRQVGRRSRIEAALRGPRRRRSRRGIRHQRAHPAVLCSLFQCRRRRRKTHARILRQPWVT